MSRDLGLTRFNEFIRFDQQQVEDIEIILETTGKTADLYRPEYTGKPGFSDEVGELKLVDRILVHLTRYGHNLVSPRGTTAEGGLETSYVNWVAITTQKDININDVLKIESDRFQVVDVIRTVRGKSELMLEKLE